MAFWSNASVEPKREFRWTLNVGSVPVWIIKSVMKPVLTVTDTAHKYFGYTYYYPGTGTWNPIDVTLVDPVSPDAVNILATIMRQAGYNPPTSPNTVQTISKEGASRALETVVISQKDANGAELEKWTLYNAFATTTDFGGSLTYDTDNLINLKLTLRYDWAELYTFNSSGLNTQNGVKASNTYWSR